MRKCYAISFNDLIGYSEGLEIQQKAFNVVKENDLDGIVLFLQHKPVITIGSNGGEDNLLVGKERLNKVGIELYETNRGGNITYHGPGQMVVYPILNLNKFKKDSHWYLRQLEEVIIQTLKTYDIEAGRKPKYTGVWVEDKKITAIGVRIKRWITMHGLAFNLSVNKDHFRLINPCGITDFGVTSLNDFLREVSYEDLLKRVREKFEEVFQVSLEVDDKMNWLEEWKIC